MAEQIPPHHRFFARIEAFHCVCPVCGKLWRSKTPGGRVSKTRLRAAGFNDVRGVAQCPHCTRKFGVGLLLHPVEPRHPLWGAGVRPPDQIPSFDEAEALRLYLGGYYLKQRIKPGDHLNLYVEAECRCNRDPEQCPIVSHREKHREGPA
jgi:hypothetical protein